MFRESSIFGMVVQNFKFKYFVNRDLCVNFRDLFIFKNLQVLFDFCLLRLPFGIENEMELRND